MSPAKLFRPSRISRRLIGDRGSFSQVCVAGSSENIAFHIRIPFLVEAEGTFHFRYHADFGLGSFIGVDGAEHTPNGIWGHMFVSDVALSLGDHEFEVLGFEDCCDGHAELEIHLSCDRINDQWRVVVTGGSPCMTCGGTVAAECGSATDSAANCGEAGTGGGCTQAVDDQPAAGEARVRLSDYPQGRIEVYTDSDGWGTVCGHWFWDSNVGADLACRSVAGGRYSGGLVYTMGDTDLPDLPIIAGCQLCLPGDTDILSCSGEAAPEGVSACRSGGGCSHARDQGAICLTAEAGADWGSTTDQVQMCHPVRVSNRVAHLLSVAIPIAAC